jgi:hypothetical protein
MTGLQGLGVGGGSNLINWVFNNDRMTEMTAFSLIIYIHLSLLDFNYRKPVILVILSLV